MSDERKRLLADYENFRKGRRQSKSVVDHTLETTTPVGVFEVLSVSCFVLFLFFNFVVFQKAHFCCFNE